MFIRRITKLFLITAFVLIICAPAAFAADGQDERIVFSVGSETFDESEIIRFIIESVSGNDMLATLMLSQSSLEDRRQVVQDVADAVLFSEGAKEEKLDERPDIVFQIKWQTIRILVQAYFDEMGKNWDFSEAAAEKYYNAHLAEFVQNEAVMASHILTETESDAIMAFLEASGSDGFEKAAINYSRDRATAAGGGHLGWVEKGTMEAPELENAIMNGRPGQIVGPVKGEYGWHVIQIIERRPARQLTLEEAMQRVMDAMHSGYIELELDKLRSKFPVTVNDEALKNLGGVPVQEK